MLYQIGFGGVPARPIGDGFDVHCLFPAIKSIPAETIELYFPIIIEANEALADSGGAGFYRGGNAQRTLYRFLCEGDVSIHDDRWMIKPWGVNGGMPGSRSRKVLWRGSMEGEKVLVTSKCDYLRVYPGMFEPLLDAYRCLVLMMYTGDVLEWITWGGGGLGDPLTRPAALVALEVHRRLVTLSGAAKNYGVVVNPSDFNVDEEATTALRAKMTEERGPLDTNGYNRGGTITELMAKCEEETGLKSPKPQWDKRPYGPHTGLEYVKEWYAKMGKEGMGGWDNA